MSLEDLEAGTFRTEELRAGIENGLANIEQIAAADKEHGRLEQAKAKRWLVDAIREWMRITDNESAGRRAA